MQLAEVVHRENGKPAPRRVPRDPAGHRPPRLGARRTAKQVLGPRRVRVRRCSRPTRPASLEYQPLGVVGVIGPWNYPVFTPMGSIAYALAAGNAVVFKPSASTPRRSAQWLVDAFAQVGARAARCCSWSPASATPARRCAAPASTSSPSPARPRTGRKVMAACAEDLTPVLMECGGKDAMIVDGDADVSRGGRRRAVGRHEQRRPDLHRHRAGLRRPTRSTTSSSTELTEKARRAAPRRRRRRLLRPDHDARPGRHHQAAHRRRARRGRPGGGRRRRRRSAAATCSRPCWSTCRRTARRCSEETFGPTLTVARVRDVDEAVGSANATPYGLAGAVFAKQARAWRSPGACGPA